MKTCYDTDAYKADIDAANMAYAAARTAAYKIYSDAIAAADAKALQDEQAPDLSTQAAEVAK